MSPSTRRRVALVAHDNRKLELLDWAAYNRNTLATHELCATGTTCWSSSGIRWSRSRTTRT